MHTINQQPINTQGKLLLQTLKGKEYFLTGQIIRLEAKSNYTKIFFTNRISMTTAKVLKDFEVMLLPLGFIRTHRSHLINKQFVEQVSNAGSIVMNDNSIAEISKRKKTAVLKALQVLRVRV